MSAPAPMVLPPPLKWAGGKRWLLPRLHLAWDDHKHRRLVEPFCGGLAVSLGLLPQRALLNDVNPHPVNLYRQIQNGLQIRIPMLNDADLFYIHRAMFNELILGRHQHSKKAASLFYYLNRTGYNGLCRFNRKGLFNVPFGRYTTIRYRRDFRPYQPVLAPWTFSSADFEALQVGDEDFIYADPPYDVEFRQYSARGFAWSEQVRLAHWLAGHRGPVVTSNQVTDRIVALYESLGFSLEFLDAPRMISCNGNRTPAKEMLAALNV